MNYGKMLYEISEFNKELDILHKHITKNDLRVKKSDYFDKQCSLLEDHLGEDRFKSTHKKLRRVNILLKLISFSCLFVILAAYIYVTWINKNFNIFKFIIDKPATYIICAFLFGIILILSLYNSILHKRLYYKIYPELKEKLRVED